MIEETDSKKKGRRRITIERRTTDILVTIKIPWRRRRRHATEKARQNMSKAQRARHVQEREVTYAKQL